MSYLFTFMNLYRLHVTVNDKNELLKSASSIELVILTINNAKACLGIELVLQTVSRHLIFILMNNASMYLYYSKVVFKYYPSMRNLLICTPATAPKATRMSPLSM